MPARSRIFTQVFESSAIAGFAGEVDASAEGHVVALRAQLAADERAIFVGSVGIPTGGAGHIGRQGRGVATILSTEADAVSGIGHLEGRNAKAGNAGNVSGAAVGVDGERAHGAESLHACAVEQGNLLLQRHDFDSEVGALIGSERGVHPRVLIHGVAGLGVGGDSYKDDCEQMPYKGGQGMCLQYSCTTSHKTCNNDFVGGFFLLRIAIQDAEPPRRRFFPDWGQHPYRINLHLTYHRYARQASYHSSIADVCVRTGLPVGWSCRSWKNIRHAEGAGGENISGE